MNSRRAHHYRDTGSAYRVCINLITLLLLLISTSGCKVTDQIAELLGFGKSTVNRTIGILDAGIARLDNESADWQSVLQDMQSQLTDDAQSMIRDEITRLMQRSVEAVSSNVKCVIDMTRARVLQDLFRIRAEFLGYPLPAAEPHICTAYPTAIDMSLPANERNILELYGFDFDTTPNVEVFLVDSNRTIDVSQYLDRPTHYMMTLNLGSAGIPLTESSQKLRLMWNDKQISSIAVIQPYTPVCEIKPDEKQTPAAITFRPPVTQGDDLFGFFNVNVNVELINQGTSILASIQMDAQEEESNQTTAAGYMEKEIIKPPAGWAIYSITSPMTDTYSDFNDDLTAEPFYGGGPVEYFLISGDQASEDPGRTIRRDIQVYIKFNEIHYALIQTGDCADPNAVVEAAGDSNLSVSTIERMVEFVPLTYWNQLPPEQLDLVKPYLIHKVATSTPAVESDFQIAPTSTPSTSSNFRVAPTATP